MSKSLGQKDIHGDFIHEGDTVHCWSGSKDQREVTQSLKGVVNIKKVPTGDIWQVGDNALALGCAEYVEII